MKNKDAPNREAFLEAILDSIQDGVSVLAPDLTLLYANDIMKEWYRPSMPIVGKKCHQVYHGSDVPCASCPARRSLSSGAMETQILPGLPGSDAKWLELFTFPMKDERTGRIKAVVEYVRNVTDKVEAEEKLREQAKKLELLRDIDRAILSAQSVQEILDQTLPKIKNLLMARRVTLVTFDEQTGQGRVRALSEDRFYPLRLGETVPLELFGFHKEHPTSVVCVEDLPNWPHKHPLHKGLIKEGIRALMLAPLVVEGNLMGVLGTGFDNPAPLCASNKALAEEIGYHLAIALRQAKLTEQIKRQNEELELRVAQRTAQLQASNRAFEEFAYSVSHDLRAPLRAISGFAEIIARRHKDLLDEEGRHYFDNIIQAADRMGELISDLLSYSRLGTSSIQSRQVSLDALVRQVLTGFEGIVAETEAEIVLPDEDLRLTTNPTLLSQILTNLIDNALKYRKPGVPPKIEIRVETTDNEAILSVMDNGMGIAPEYLDKIFDIFQRLHSREEYPGTGIGLATVKKAATLLGGSVSVSSRPGEGSVFSLHLPRNTNLEQ